MADEILVAARCVVALPNAIKPTDASLVEPLAIAVHGFNRVGARPGERVLVVAAGRSGSTR